jgi:hypothetical protein
MSGDLSLAVFAGAMLYYSDPDSFPKKKEV